MSDEPEQLDPARPNLRLAGAVVLDHEQRALFIDGIEFPYYIAERGPSVELDDSTDPATCIVLLPVLCETYDVVGEPE